MTITEITQVTVAGGLLGTLGQGIRIAVGLKKLNEENTARSLSDKGEKPFSASRLLISVFIGFVAGALAMLIKYASTDKPETNNTEIVIMIIAAGYAGVDFIEGIFITYGSKLKPSTTPTNPVSVDGNSNQVDIAG